METSETGTNDIQFARLYLDVVINDAKVAVRSHANEIIRLAEALDEGLGADDTYKVVSYLHAIAQQIQQGVRVASKWESLKGVQRELDKNFGFSDI